MTLTCGIFQRHQIRLHPKRDQQVLARMRRALRPSIVHNYSSSVSYEYRYVLKIDDVEHPLGGVTWADFDQRHRLILAKEGKLFSAVPEAGELVLTELGDFNEQDYPKKRKE